MSYGDDYEDPRDRGTPSQTRTRLPEEPESTSRRASPRRSLVTLVGIVTLLVAAIVFANQSSETDPGTDVPPAPDPQAHPTAPTGELPVTGDSHGIPTGFDRTAQGAQSAAANYAVALGGTGMFVRQSRHTIVDTVYESETAEGLKPEQDDAYSEDFLARLGLDADGIAPPAMMFVSRTIPVGSTVIAYDESTAIIEVWCAGLIGMSGADSTDPVRTDWKTWTFELQWVEKDWKVIDDSQADGPAPVPGDTRASPTDEIAEALNAYGGFTYAR